MFKHFRLSFEMALTGNLTGESSTDAQTSSLFDSSI